MRSIGAKAEQRAFAAGLRDLDRRSVLEGRDVVRSDGDHTTCMDPRWLICRDQVEPEDGSKSPQAKAKRQAVTSCQLGRRRREGTRSRKPTVGTLSSKYACAGPLEAACAGGT